MKTKRNLAVAQRVEVLGGRHLQVVGARQLERENRRAPEARDLRRDPRPGQALGGRSPAGGRAEQLGELLPRGGVVAAAGGIDHHLGGERDRLDLQTAGVGGGRGEQHRRGRGERYVPGAGDRELWLGRRRGVG